MLNGNTKSKACTSNLIGILPSKINKLITGNNPTTNIYSATFTLIEFSDSILNRHSMLLSKLLIKLTERHTPALITEDFLISGSSTILNRLFKTTSLAFILFDFFIKDVVRSIFIDLGFKPINLTADILKFIFVNLNLSRVTLYCNLRDAAGTPTPE